MDNQLMDQFLNPSSLHSPLPQTFWDSLRKWKYKLMLAFNSTLAFWHIVCLHPTKHIFVTPTMQLMKPGRMLPLALIMENNPIMYHSYVDEISNILCIYHQVTRSHPKEKDHKPTEKSWCRQT